MIALAEFAQALPYCKKRLLPCQRRQALIFPERQGGASGQASLIRFAAALPIGIHSIAVASSMGSPMVLPRHRTEAPSNCEGSVIGNHLLASRWNGAYSSFSQLFRNIQFREKWITYCGVEQSGSSPGS